MGSCERPRYENLKEKLRKSGLVNRVYSLCTSHQNLTAPSQTTTGRKERTRMPTKAQDIRLASSCCLSTSFSPSQSTGFHQTLRMLPFRASPQMKNRNQSPTEHTAADAAPYPLGAPTTSKCSC